MPVVELHLIEGYGSDDKRRLGEALTDAVRSIVPAQPEGVVVMIHEMKADGYYRGRGTKTPAPALPDPCDLVRNFLAAMQRRDLNAARDMLGEGFTMQFPGAPIMTTLEELVTWSAPRYRYVEKSYDGIETLQSAGAAAVVYARGTLAGEWLDGSTFSSIRFIDRFEIENRKLTRQEVWNDMAEEKAKV